MTVNHEMQIADARERVRRYVADMGVAEGDVRIVPLTGDASDRQYIRVLRPEGAPIVLALHAGPISYSALPFVNVHELLAAMPLPVPKLLGHADALGIIAQEDLGDVTLQAHLGTAPPAEHAALYREAVSLIETMQRRGRELASPAYLPYSVAFDVEKLSWELQYFTKHFLEGYRGAVLAPGERAALAAEFAPIVEELAGEPRVLCHRDYHSRNLMLHDGRLYIIDFQDARLGPDTYDLVSLLRDSYVDFTDAQIEELIAYFLALHRVNGDGRAMDGAEFRRRFDLMSVQRNLKALGTFGFQTTARGNPVYIQYIPRTLAHVRQNLLKYPRFERLRELLAAHVSELR